MTTPQNLNHQRTIAQKVLAGISDIEVQNQLQDFLVSIVEYVGDTIETVVINDIKYTAIFSEDSGHFLTLRAYPNDLEENVGFPIEARTSLINRREESQGLTIDDTPESLITTRLRRLIDKLADTAVYLLSNQGLPSYCFTDIIPYANVSHVKQSQFALHSTSTELYYQNANFVRSFYVRVEEDYRRLYGKDLHIYIRGELTPGHISSFKAEIRTRFGHIEYTLPFIYLTDEQEEKVKESHTYRIELIDSLINAQFVQNILNGITLEAFDHIKEQYRLHVKRIRDHYRDESSIEVRSTNAEIINIFKEKDLIFSFLPYYRGFFLENDIRTNMGVDVRLVEGSELTITSEEIFTNLGRSEEEVNR